MARVRALIASLVIVSGCKDGCSHAWDDVPKTVGVATASSSPQASASTIASASASAPASAAASAEPPPADDGDPPLAVTPGPAHRFIAAGGHTCVIDPDRKVRCWGGGHDASAAIDGIDGAVSVAVGASHTCALTTSGRVACFGSNKKGQLGDGTTTDRKTPTFVPHLRAVALGAGDDGTCAINGAGNVVCWGVSVPAQEPTGDAQAPVVSTPTEVLDNLKKKVAATTLDVGASTCALSATSLTCWGAGRLFAPYRSMKMAAWSMDDPHPEEVLTAGGGGKRVALGRANCLLRETGALQCWGPNDQGQRGDAVAETSAFDPRGSVTLAFDSTTSVDDASGPKLVATDLAASSNEVCIVTTAHHVACWGVNDDGELGDGTKTTRKTPVDAKGITTAVAVAVGNAHACAVLANGTVSCWGDNSAGAVTGSTTDDDVTTPRALSGVTVRAAP